jgi:hypothetical protein
VETPLNNLAKKGFFSAEEKGFRLIKGKKAQEMGYEKRYFLRDY